VGHEGSTKRQLAGYGPEGSDMRCADTVRKGRSLVSPTDRNEVRMMFVMFSSVARPWYWVYLGGGGYVMFRKHVLNVVSFEYGKGRDKAKSQVTLVEGAAIGVE
jgi:hypothetical protein